MSFEINKNTGQEEFGCIYTLLVVAQMMELTHIYVFGKIREFSVVLQTFNFFFSCFFSNRLS